MRVVRLEARPNSAAGPVPWGPPRTDSDIVVSADRPLPSAPIAGEAVLVVGQDIHRHPFARAAVDRLRAEHAQVLVVDMGWPSPDRRYADVATFGAVGADGPRAAGVPPVAARRAATVEAAMESSSCRPPAEVGRLAARKIAQVITRKPTAVIGLATGSSPLAIYAELAGQVRDGELDPGRCAASLSTSTSASRRAPRVVPLGAHAGR